MKEIPARSKDKDLRIITGVEQCGQMITSARGKLPIFEYQSCCIQISRCGDQSAQKNGSRFWER